MRGGGEGGSMGGLVVTRKGAGRSWPNSAAAASAGSTRTSVATETITGC